MSRWPSWSVDASLSLALPVASLPPVLACAEPSFFTYCDWSAMRMPFPPSALWSIVVSE